MPFGIKEGNRLRIVASRKSGALVIAYLVLCLGAFVPGYAQDSQPAVDPAEPAAAQPAPEYPAPPSKPTTEIPVTAPQATASKTKFPFDAATQPAKIRVDNGRLTVEANNSDLSQILNQVAGISGITIKGINGGQRVFGVYGPGDAEQVLTALLTGSGYNFIMIGGAGNGQPRELLLTPRVNHAASPPVADAEPSEDSDDADDSEPPPPPPPPPSQPSAAAESPSSGTPPAPNDEEVQRTLERMKVIYDHQQDPPQTPPQ